MTGPEHYSEAEALLEAVRQEHHGTLREHGGELLAMAQVHATLAMAASVGLSAHLPVPDQHAWQEAAGSPCTG
jgi:hypothetical protein